MKKMITAVAVVALGASLALAAPHGEGRDGGHRGRRGDFSMKFMQKLNLTDAQKQQMKTVRQNFRQQNEALFSGFHQTMKEYRAAKQANDTAKAESLKATLDSQKAQVAQAHKAEHEQMLTVLTAEQRAQYDAMKAEWKAKREQRRQERQNSNTQPQS